jgi:hypothetical protein
VQNLKARHFKPFEFFDHTGSRMEFLRTTVVEHGTAERDCAIVTFCDSCLARSSSVVRIVSSVNRSKEVIDHEICYLPA